MNDKIESPDYLAAPITAKGNPANRRYLLIALALVLFCCAVVAWGYKTRYDEAYGERQAQEEEEKKMTRFSAPAVSRPEGPDVMLPPSPPPEIFSHPVAAQGNYPTAPQQVPDHVRDRYAAHKAALAADPEVTEFSQNKKALSEGTMPMPREEDDRQRRPDDLNRQAEKREFLDSFDKAASPYLNQTRIPAISPHEVKAGFIIPGVMISGINSDLPGQIIGQVRQNVYDSATGRFLLIPAGAKLVGTYDSSVSAGQERVLVAWNRIIFPDSSSVSIEAMPGADKSGFAGFHDKVDNHYWRTFGNAALLSLFSAGIQLSQPQAAVSGTYNSQQIMAAEIGRQLGRLGMQLTQRNLNIQPTLEIRPGFQFSIMVTKDMILPPWKG